MIPRTFFPFRKQPILLLCGLLAGGTLVAESQPFNKGWRFIRSSEMETERPAVEDPRWRPVDLPHDWSIEDLPEGPGIVGPFDSSMEEGQDVGYLRGGTGWYEKSFTLDRDTSGRRVEVVFDGAQQNATIWCNGIQISEHFHGYTPIAVDLTPHLHPAGEENRITVRCVNPEQNSRWFPGSGLYREATLRITDPLHIPLWGPFFHTASLQGERATLHYSVPVLNARDSAADVSVELTLEAPDGATSRHSLGQSHLAAGGDFTLEGDLELDSIQSWSPEHPHLYQIHLVLRKGDAVIQRESFAWGFRVLAWSAADGFLLNGESILLRGGNVHHDNGLLGAAAFPDAESRRVALLKKHGYNAIRTAHNPPSRAFLEACDRIGMLVIDEFVDMWTRPKRPNDYSNHFAEQWQKDLSAWVRRDRLHPSVVMWSIGNEVNERGASVGIAIAANMIEVVRSLDPGRPVTNGICGFWDNPGWEWERADPAFALLDIGGYNYQPQQYESDHERFPERIMFGSESVTGEALRYWDAVEQHAYVIGDFVWTAMDYIGEAGIGHFSYTWDPDFEDNFHQPWPWWVAWCGELDLIGNPKSPLLYRNVVWRNSPLEILVHAPVPPGAKEVVHFWGWPDEEPHWNWSGHEGEPLEVNVYTRADSVRFELNGEVLGTAEATGGEGLKATLSVPYAPGVLTAVALRDGREIGRQSLATTDKPSAVRIAPEQDFLRAERSALLFVPIEIVDQDATVVPTATSHLEVTVAGPAELIALGSADPLVPGSLQDGTTRAFRGRALAILRSTGEAGTVRLEVINDSLGNEAVEIPARR